MTIQNQILDRFVMRIKESGSLENVRFVHSNNMTPVQQPVSKFTVCCSVERSVLNDGYISGAENLQTAYPCEASLSFIRSSKNSQRKHTAHLQELKMHWCISAVSKAIRCSAFQTEAV